MKNILKHIYWDWTIFWSMIFIAVMDVAAAVYIYNPFGLFK